MATDNTKTTTRNKPGPKPGSRKGAAAKKDAAKQADGSASPPTNGAAAAADKPDMPKAGTPAPQPERSPFLYKNRDYLTITETGQKGQVRARAEYASGAVAYLLAYSSNGDLKEAWIDQELVSPFVERRARP